MNEVTKSLFLKRENLIHCLSYTILPLAINGSNRINIFISIGLCFILLVKVTSSNFRIYLSQNSKDIIFNLIMFASPAIGICWNQGYSSEQYELMYSNFIYLLPILVISISFVLITGDIRNKDWDFKFLCLFLFTFTLVVIFQIALVSNQFDLRIIYTYYNTKAFMDLINSTLMGSVSLGAWWDLTISLPFLLLYIAIPLRIHVRILLISFVPSFLFLVSLGSRGGLFLYVLNFILISMLNNRNGRFVWNLKSIIILISLLLFMGIIFLCLSSFLDIRDFSLFQRANGDLAQDTGRFNMWSYFIDNIDKISLFNSYLSATDMSDQESFHNYVLDSAQFAGMLGLILSIASCLFVFKSSTTYLTKLISFTIIISKLCGVPPFSSLFTYFTILCIYPILNRSFNQRDTLKSMQ